MAEFRHEYSSDVLATAFATAGHLSLTLLTSHYLIAYKPRRNGVDSIVLRGSRRCFHKLRTSILGPPGRKSESYNLGIASFLEEWLRLCLVNLADVQVILSFTLLNALYGAAITIVPAAQWQFVMHLAWFPVIACLCSISILSSDSSNINNSRGRRFCEGLPKLCRALALTVLLCWMLLGFVPTIFFNWEYGRGEPSAALPATDARDFLSDFTGELARFRDKGRGLTRALSHTHGFQLALFSAVALLLVTFLVLGKAIFNSPKEERTSGISGRGDDAATNTFSRWLGLERGVRLEDLHDIESVAADVRSKQRSLGGILSDTTIFFLAFNLDLLTSRVAEIFLLLVLHLWGAARLYGSSLKSEGQITNGQSLWRFSQQLPMVLLVVPFIVATNSYLLGGASSKPPPANEQDATLTNVVLLSPTESLPGSRDSNDADDDESPPAAYPTPWTGVPLVCGSGLLLVVTIAFFAATFNMGMGFEPQFLVSEALFTVLGIFWVVIPGYPLACFATALAAYAMERRWIHKLRSSTTANDGTEFSKWQVRDYALLFMIGVAAHAFSPIVLLIHCII